MVSASYPILFSIDGHKADPVGKTDAKSITIGSISVQGSTKTVARKR